MGGYLIRRVAQLLPVMVLASICVFLMLRWIPGDPAQILAGPDATPEQIESVRKELGLDSTWITQYGVWLNHLIHGDLGKSFISGQPVRTLIARRLPATVTLALAAILISVVTALPLGLIAAVRQRSPFDYLVTLLSGVALAIPNFWLGILLVLVFALYVKWFPPFGWRDPFTDPIAAARYLILPASTLSLHMTAVLAQFTRSTTLEVLRQDYVRTARAKGLAETRLIVLHVLRNALIPIVTVVGIQFGQLLGGVIVVEAIFSWPGIGQLLLQGVLNRDYPIVQGTLVVTVGLFLLVNLLTDVAYAYIDPRIRVAGKRA